MKVKLAYGRGSLEVTLPDKNVVKVLGYKSLDPLVDPIQATFGILESPISALPLREIARGKKTACILISDITRPVPNQIILPPILQTLEASGVPRDGILILVGTGMHRPSTPQEKLEMCGEEIAKHYRIEDHYARELSQHTSLGVSPNGVPLWVDTRYIEAELKIATGLIEPHFMAGFSGGRKAICPGVCGMDTIAKWHSPKFLEHENAKNGVLKGNPVHEENTWIARKAGCDFIVNVVLNAAREILCVVGGDMEKAHEEGVRFARTFVSDTVPEPVEIVVTSGAGYPLDTTWYQSVKGIVAALDILKPGGTVILASSCTEGLGSKEFIEIARRFPRIEDFLDAIIKEEFFLLNQWQMEELGKVLRKGKVKVVTNGLPPETIRQYYVQYAETVEQAIEECLREYGSEATIAVLPEGPYVLAELANPKNSD